MNEEESIISHYESSAKALHIHSSMPLINVVGGNKVGRTEDDEEQKQIRHHEWERKVK